MVIFQITIKQRSKLAAGIQEMIVPMTFVKYLMVGKMVGKSRTKSFSFCFFSSVGVMIIFTESITKSKIIVL